MIFPVLIVIGMYHAPLPKIR